MENEERAALESRYQTKNGEGTSTQPPIGASTAHVLGVSQNLGADSITEQHFTPVIPTQPPQTHVTVDLTADGPPDNRSTGFMNDDKISALEERLRAVEGNDWFDPMRASEYKFNLKIAPDRTSLMSMEKRSQESVRVYAQRWRDEATHVQPPLIETEMVTLFANTFKAPYYEHLMGSSSQHFYDDVRVAERIEQGIKAGRISEPLEKKGFVGRKREGDVNNLEGEYKGKKVNYQNPQIPTHQFANMNFAKPFNTNRANPQPNNQNNQRPYTGYSSEQLPPLPMPLKDLYAKLLSIGQIAPILLPPIQPPFPLWYKPELTCEYHAGNPGHGIETCYAFKRRLLELIKRGWVSFEDMPSINSNPLPNHAASNNGVGMIEVGNQSKVLKVSMKELYGMLVKSGFLEINIEGQFEGGDYCEFHGREGHHIENCIEFRKKVAKMMALGELRIEPAEGNHEVSMMEGQDKMSRVYRVQPTANGPPKLILAKPSHTKGNHNAMPYNYGFAANIQASLPLFQTEISGLTRSGRCFTPEELRKAKGKEVVDLDKATEVNKPVTEEELNEFLNSEPHRNALQKVLNEAYVPQDIEQKTMEHLVGRIHATNYLYFTTDELDAEGTGHNKPLYITVRCKDCLIGKVLVDNGSALNVLPKHILEEMPIDESHMKPSTMMARAYDGSPRPIIGTLEVELYVGPQMFLVTFQVMDIHPSYSMLLGRPWIHTAGAVTSSLHQCLKYIMNGMLVTVKAEETVSMIKNVAIPFIEAEDCKDNNIHAFEIVNTDWVPENTVLRRPRISEAARMVAQCLLERGIPFQYNPITEIPKRANPIKMKGADQRFGLGYKPKKEDHRWAASRRRERRMARIEGREPEEEKLEIPPLRVTFPKAAYVMQPNEGVESLGQELSNISINTLEEDNMEGGDMKMVAGEEDEALPQLTIHTMEEVSTETFVRKLAEGEKFQNWVTQEAPETLKADLPQTSHTLSIKRMNGQTLTNMVITMEEEEWDESNVKEFYESFLEVVKYPQWVSNIVVVPKKEGKIKVCVDFRNLNKASPKDDFPLPHIDVLVDNVARSSTYSFMDGFSGYNQIKMALEDKAKMTFCYPWGTYCYKVMPFGLKNAGSHLSESHGKCVDMLCSGLTMLAASVQLSTSITRTSLSIAIIYIDYRALNVSAVRIFPYGRFSGNYFAVGWLRGNPIVYEVPIDSW
ncbi:uncharacterized protein [Populus alba]|uniref:uncharacterized protein n=1 Tax=Populus alba TaxID=43335 RepID=UPI003CC75B42